MKKQTGTICCLGKIHNVLEGCGFALFIDSNGVIRETSKQYDSHSEWLLLCKDKQGNTFYEMFNGEIDDLTHYAYYNNPKYEIVSINMYFRGNVSIGLDDVSQVVD